MFTTLYGGVLVALLFATTTIAQSPCAPLDCALYDNACMQSNCNPLTGQCEFVFFDPVPIACTCSSLCGDGLLECAEQCENPLTDECCNIYTCTYQPPTTSCLTGDLCATHTCLSGLCTYQADIPCVNPDPCASPSTCVAGTGCVAGPPLPPPTAPLLSVDTLDGVLCDSANTLSIVDVFPPPFLFDGATDVSYSVALSPLGASPIVSADNIAFDGDGPYYLEAVVQTPCGPVFSQQLLVDVQDCCGNGVLDHGEQCDPPPLLPNNGCCNACRYSPAGTPCVDDGNPCTYAHECDSLGTCTSQQNVAFTLNAQQPLSVVDTTCRVDTWEPQLSVTISDPVDQTPGSYLWQLSVTSSSHPWHAVLVGSGTSSSSSGSPISSPTPQVHMEGGGTLSVHLLVTGPCNEQRTLDFAFERLCCGNGLINTGEACDRSQTCSPDCSTVLSVCGDGRVTGNELCDTALHACCGPDCFSLLGPTVACRPQTGPCDRAEFCDPSDPVGPWSCPPDLYLPAALPCRSSTSICDPPENCTGVSPQCPPDLVAQSTALARIPQGPCELPAYCSGLDKVVPPRDYLPASHLCQSPPSQCRGPAFCPGSSHLCPGTPPLPIATPCDADANTCTQDQCDGAGACVQIQAFCECTIDAHCSTPHPQCMSARCDVQSLSCLIDQLPGTCFVDGQCFVDGALNPQNPCQLCDSTQTPSAWTDASPSTPCSTLSPGGPCSAQDTCDGLGRCVDRYLTGVCRPALAPAPGTNITCDLPESCTGLSDLCPADLFVPGGSPCRMPGPLQECLIQATCTGSSAICPPEQYHDRFRACGSAPRGPCELQRTCDPTSPPADPRLCPPERFLGPQQVCNDPLPSHDCERVSRCADPSVPFDPLDPTSLHPWECEPISFHGPETACGPSPRGPCELQRTCDRQGPFCPAAPLKAQAGSQCGVAPDRCASAPTCDPLSPTWWLCPPPTILPQGTVCRQGNGTCNPDDLCDGQTFRCEDVRRTSQWECGMPRGPCELVSHCDPASPTWWACPPPSFRNASEVCSYAAPTDLCDLDDLCPGPLGAQPWLCGEDLVLPQGHYCNPIRGTCHKGAQCVGPQQGPSSKRCPVEQWYGSEATCHQPQGPCEESVQCDGVSDACPPRSYLGTDVLCSQPSDPCTLPAHCDPNHARPHLCPPSAILGNDTVCYLPLLPCELPGRCRQGACEGATYRPAGYICERRSPPCLPHGRCLGAGAGECPPAPIAPAGTPCDLDALLCTTDQCNQGGACALVEDNCGCHFDHECPTNHTECVLPRCLNGHCQVDLSPIHCLIDSVCYPEGVLDPLNPCLSCQPPADPTTWTPVEQGTPCDTGFPHDVCSAQDVCSGAGLCVDVHRPATTVCRPASGDCDREETCTGSSDYCPPDSTLGVLHRCHVSDLPCDVDRYCTESGRRCPEDRAAPSTTVCAAARGPCEQSAHCRGTDPTQDPLAKLCPDRLLLPVGAACGPPPMGCEERSICGSSGNRTWECPPKELSSDTKVCRHAQGSCDRDELCDPLLLLLLPGHTDPRLCPPDRMHGPRWMCSGSRGPCEQDAFCTLGTAQCPERSLLPTSFQCYTPIEPCGIPQTCDPTGVPPWLCPDPSVLSRGVPCGPTPRGPCEEQGACDGTSERCPPPEPSPTTKVCRATPSSQCNPPESCDPTAATAHWECPPDLVLPDGTSCAGMLFCEGDRTCEGGMCIADPLGPRTCDDGDACTADHCDEVLDRCVHTPPTQVGQPCYTGEPPETANVGRCRDGTLQCDPQTAIVNCEDEVLPQREQCGNLLDDDCDGVADEGCTGESCTSNADCLSFLPSACHSASCNGTSGGCIYALMPQYCYVDSTCRNHNEPHPRNPCLWCDIARSTTGWSNHNAATVDDGDVCNGVEHCRAGHLIINPGSLACTGTGISGPQGCLVESCHPLLGCITELRTDNTSCALQEGLFCDVPPRCSNGECTCSGQLYDNTGGLGPPLWSAIAIGVLISSVLTFLRFMWRWPSAWRTSYRVRAPAISNNPATQEFPTNFSLQTTPTTSTPVLDITSSFILPVSSLQTNGANEKPKHT